MIDVNNEPSKVSFSDVSEDGYSNSLMDIVLVLFRNLKIILIIPTLTCMVMILNILFFTSPVYTSKSSFMSSSSKGAQSVMSGLAYQFGLVAPSASSAEWSSLDIVNSRKMATALLNRKFDTDLYGKQQILLDIISGDNIRESLEYELFYESAIFVVQNMIELEIAGNLNVLKVTTFEPLLSKTLAMAVLDELDRHQRDYNSNKALETRTFIDDRLFDSRMQLEKAEVLLKEFRERNRSISQSPQLQLEQERLSRDVSVLTGVFTTLKQQLETAKIDAVKKMENIIPLDYPNNPLTPDRTNKKLSIILAGLLGIGIGVMFAFINEYFKGASDIQRRKINEIKSILIDLGKYILPKKYINS